MNCLAKIHQKNSCTLALPYASMNASIAKKFPSVNARANPYPGSLKSRAVWALEDWDKSHNVSHNGSCSKILFKSGFLILLFKSISSGNFLYFVWSIKSLHSRQKEFKMTTTKSCCFIHDKNINIDNRTAEIKATISDGQAVLAVGNLIQGNVQKLNGPII